MTEEPDVTQSLNIAAAEVLGRVMRVDTSRVIVDVTEHTILTRVAVGNLVAIQGTTLFEYLIGIVDRVTRDTSEMPVLDAEDEQGEIPIQATQRDLIRVVLVGTYRLGAGDKASSFKRGADSFPQVDRPCYLLESGNLQQLMALFAEGLDADEQLVLGHFVADRDAAAIADGNRLFQRHAALLGSTGTGKSWTVALILERAAKLKFPNLLVLDMHGEYAPLTDPEAGFAEGFRIAGPGDLDAKTPDILFLPYWLLNQEEMFALLLDRSDQNAPNQAARFTYHVRELKREALEAADQKVTAATFTVDSPVPYSLKDLLARLRADDTEMIAGSGGREKQGPFYGKLTRFVNRLETKIDDRRYGFLFQPTAESNEYSWLAESARRLLCSGEAVRGVKVIDFSEVPADVLPVVTGVLARTLYDVQFWMREDERTPVTFVCDEAHLYLPVAELTGTAEGRALAAFERIAKEGRKYGVSLFVISQRPADVSRTILSQCNNFIAMRLTNDQDQMVVRRLTSESLVGLVDVLPLLDVGEALLLGDAVLLPTRIKMDEPTIKPASATRAFWTEWGTRQPVPKAIDAAVEAFRRQVRPRGEDIES
jgi:uncharacterized protein